MYFIYYFSFVRQKVLDMVFFYQNTFKSTSNFIDELVIINVDQKRNYEFF